MGRAPTGAVPQRVSAPATPKAPSFVPEDEDEKTMIESGWEEEASTTVEQGDVADRIRALGLGLEPAKRANSSITSTSGGTAEEPTVDDQRASAAVALLPPVIVARLVITQGNDAGQSLEVRAGKTYTIGRGIDNDLVLTDLAVSRKHFDIRNDNGAWVLADRGSGNGTLVNAQLEDAPFMLTTGDVIEIGNTAFRFELPINVPRISVPRIGFDTGPEDEIDQSTLSSAPVRDPDAAFPTPASNPVARPKPALQPAASPPQPTVPLPRPRAPTSRPLAGYMLDRPGAQSQPMAAAVPVATPVSLPAVQTGALPTAERALATANPANTLSGHAPVQLSPPARLAFPYPSRAEMAPQPTPGGTRVPLTSPSPRAGQPGHDHTATAVVHPISYSNQLPAQALPPPHRAGPQLSQRAKLTLAAAAVALFVAILTLAVLRSSSGDPEPAEPAAAIQPAPDALPPTVEPIREPPAKPVKAAADKPTQASVAQPATTPPAAVKLTPPAAPAGAIPPPIPAVKAAIPPRIEPAPVAKPDPKKAPKRAEPKKIERKAAMRADDRDDKPDAAETAKPDRKRAGRTVQDVKSEASVLYRVKNFSGAAALVSGSLALFTGDDLKDIKNTAAIYAQLGRAYNVGMAPGTKPTEAYQALLRAQYCDRDLGKAYLPEIEQRLVTVASRAAMSYMAAKDYDAAFKAVRTSDALGGSSSASNKSVRDALDTVATDLVRAASAQLASDPAEAKAKLRVVLTIVEQKNPLYVKATKLLNAP